MGEIIVKVCSNGRMSLTLDFESKLY